MAAKSSNQIVGKTYNLSVICMVPRDGIMCMMVAFENKRIAVPMLFSQLGKSLPKVISCKVVSVNELGFPVLEQTQKGELAYLPGFKKPNQVKPSTKQVNKENKDKASNSQKPHSESKVKANNDNVVVKKVESLAKTTDSTPKKSMTKLSNEVDRDFIEWRESQQRELEAQREQLSNALLGRALHSQTGKPQVSPCTPGHSLVPQISQSESKKLGKKKEPQEYECESHFIEDYIAKNHKMSDFIYHDKSVPFVKYLQATGSIALRYKLLIALSDLISKYHKTNQIIGDINPTNFEIVSDEPLSLRMINKDMVSYKTNMIHQREGLHYMAPEVKNHLSPITQMSESYSFALIVIHMLTGDEYQGKGEFGKSSYITNNVIDILCQSLAPDPTLRPKIEKWSFALREGLDGLVYCNRCQQWYAPKQSVCCSCCNQKTKFAISLQVGLYGNAEVYNVERNIMEFRTTLIGNSKGNVILTESTSKVLNGYEFGLSENKDITVAVISISQCNSNNDVTLHIIPIPGNQFTLLDSNYQQKGDSFDKSTDIEIHGEELYKTMFLVESKVIKNKILKICHM